MSVKMQQWTLRIAAVALAAGMLFTDRAVPDQVWALAGVLAGASEVRRPGDTDPVELARMLEGSGQAPSA